MNTQQEAKEMKECPFCGGTPELITRGNDYGKSRSAEIVCKPCGVKVIVAAIRNNSEWCQSKVLEKWNNRTGQSTHPIAADAEALAKEFAGTNYTKNHFPRRYQDRIDGFLAGFKEGYASQPKGAGVAKSFLSVLEENYQAQIAGYYNHDKTYVEKQRRNAVIEEYKDLIAIFKSNFSSLPSQEGQQ